MKVRLLPTSVVAAFGAVLLLVAVGAVLWSAPALSQTPLADESVEAAPTGRTAVTYGTLPAGKLSGEEPSSEARIGARIPPSVSASKNAEFVSYFPPGDDLVYEIAARRAGPGATAAQIEAAGEDFRTEWSATHYHGPDPVKRDELIARERRLLAGGHRIQQQIPVSGSMRLVVIAVEFAGSEEVVDFSHEEGLRTGKCVTETATYSGPLHNEIPPPGALDNRSMYGPEFDADYFDKIIFSEEGITERVRMDLIDPEDGGQGIDISGLTMANFYREMSKGNVSIERGPAPPVAWVQVPHSVAYYAANACVDGQVSGSGLPSNPNGESQLYQDIVDAMKVQYPEFPWRDYDTDHDGILDHVELIHAGIDESSGGGEDGTNQIWAHRGSAGGSTGLVVDDGGTPDDPADDVHLRGYTMQGENIDLGVLVHEFGHDLGLLDLYTNTGTESTAWFDLMSLGGLLGRLQGSDPAHMSAHSKWVLGWNEMTPVTPRSTVQEVVLGQASMPPAGTTSAVKIDLPPTQVQYADPEGDSVQVWWSGADQNWADVRLSRTVNLTGVTGPISVTYDLDYAIEADWDYLFLEASEDGETFTQLKGLAVGTGDELTTPDDYPDPNHRLADYGGLVHGYTGDSDGWKAVYHDLSAYAGKSITLRFRYATDAGFLERGAFVDNVRVLAGPRVVFSDPVEDDNANGWIAEARSFQGEAVGAGWRMSDGIDNFARYYVLEWRSEAGYDRGLKYAYNSLFSRVGADGRREWRVDPIGANLPGLVVWLRDARFEYGAERPANEIMSDGQFRAPPSEGPKGGLIAVDAHFEPLRGPRRGKYTNALGTFPFPPDNNWGGRTQTVNLLFGLADTPPMTLTVVTGGTVPTSTVMTPTMYTAQPARPGFHDSLGYYPGVEALPVPIKTYSDTQLLRIKPYTFVDPDASAVVPAAGYYSPRTPPGFTGHGGETSPPSASVSTCETFYIEDPERPHLLGPTATCVSIGAVGETDVVGEQSGNPGDTGVHFGMHFEVAAQGADGSWGKVRIWRAAEAADAFAELNATPDEHLGANARMVNTGQATTVTLYSDFDETRAGLVDGSWTAGVIPVKATGPEVAELVRASGPSAVATLRVPAAEATALAWAGWLSTGAAMEFDYQLETDSPHTVVTLWNSVFGTGEDAPALDVASTQLALVRCIYLPIAGWRNQ